MLAEKLFEKTTIRNDRTEMLPKNVSAKKVSQSIRTEKLAEKAFEKTTIEMTVLKCCPKMYSRKQSFKMSVLKC